MFGKKGSDHNSFPTCASQATAGMATGMRNIRRRTRRFKTETGGSAAVAFATALPVVVGFTALAADIGHVYSQEEKLKQLTETVALAALVEVRDEKYYGINGRANPFKSDLVALAKTNMNAAAGSAIKEEDIEFGTWDFSKEVFSPIGIDAPVSAVRVKGLMNAERGNQLPSFFGKLFTDKYDISVETVAVMPIPPDYHVLSETASHSVIVEDSDIDTLRMIVNSTARDALWVPGNGVTSFGTWQFHLAGDYEGSYKGKREAARKVKTNVPGIKDFLEGQPSPPIGSCDWTNRTAWPSPSGRITVWPGVYCGGLKINAPADKVEFKPGTYIFKDGPLLIENQREVIGDRVHLFLTGKTGGLEIKGSTVRLRAQKTGKYAGMTIMSDRRASHAPTRHLIEGSNLALVGTVYTPRSKLELNFVHFNTSCRFICLVTDTLALRSTYINSYHGYRLPHYTFPGGNDIPTPIGVAKTFRPYLMEQVVVPGNPKEPPT